VCFNDRWVKADGGFYDGLTELAIDDEAYDWAWKESGLKGHGVTCDGYYTGDLGASLLYDGNEAPFLPPCEWRNLKNKSLRNRAWFERPCEPERSGILPE
jgi:hypothetical protein